MAEIIVKLVSNPRFAAMMQEKINTNIDSTIIEQELSVMEKQLRRCRSTNGKLPIVEQDMDLS